MLIIFDLDGTLINTISDLGQACNHALEACGFPTHKIEDYPRLVGNGVNKLIERSLPQEHRNEATVLRLREFFVPFYDQHNCDLTRPYEGIPELLHALKQQGHTLAVASNKYQAATEKIVSQLFPGIFEVVLGEREGISRKPDPQIVYDIIQRIAPDTDLSTALYIGDSSVDAETAWAANSQLLVQFAQGAEKRSIPTQFVKLALCTWGFSPASAMEALQPDFLIHHPSEVLNILPRL